MTDKIETRGKTVDDAVREALLRMGARRDEVSVKILEEPKPGFLGFLGGRQAKVLVEKKQGRRGGRGGRNRPQGEQKAHSLGDGRSGGRQGGRDGGRDGGRSGGRGGGRGGRDGGGEGGRDGNRRGRGPRGGGRTGQQGQRPDDRGGTQAEARKNNAPNRAPEPAREQENRTEGGSQGGARTGGREGGRRRGSRGRRGRGPSSARVQDTNNQTESRGSDTMKADNNHPEAPRAESRPARPVEKETPPAAQQGGAPEPVQDQILASGISSLKYAKPLRGVTEEDLNENLVNLASGMLIRSGFPCRCEVHQGEYREIRVITDDSSAGILIGRRGATVDAVEHIVERMASNAHGDRVRMNLDINNYRRRREDSLVDRVADAIDKVNETGEPVHTDPMNARERRIVHMEAAEAGLETTTVPDSIGKHVVISLKKEVGEPVEDTQSPEEQAGE